MTLTPTQAWSRRVRRVGGFIQMAFAAFWLARGSLNIAGGTGTALAVVLVTVAAAVTAYGIRITAGTAPRPPGAEGRRIERSVTIATVIQLAASFALPAIVIATRHSTWVLPSIAVTIGPLLLWLDHLVNIPRYRTTGIALIVGPMLLTATLAGTSLAATTGIAAGALLMAVAAAGFHDLAQIRLHRVLPTSPVAAGSRSGPEVLPPSPSRLPGPYGEGHRSQ